MPKTDKTIQNCITSKTLLFGIIQNENQFFNSFVAKFNCWKNKLLIDSNQFLFDFNLVLVKSTQTLLSEQKNFIAQIPTIHLVYLTKQFSHRQFTLTICEKTNET